tara:strand:+ start:95 stop:724 length:630 start_codon:yes stop_codon:yes gene_type:complete
MIILVFDTETTGLPERNASIKDTEKWPYIIQLSFVCFDVSSNNIIKKYDNYIKIKGTIELTDEVKKITNIDETNIANGVNITEALNKFNKYMNISNLIVAHNISFDKRVIMVECIRNKMKQQFVKFNYNQQIRINEYCTMKNNKDLFENKKYPKLIELHKKLFDEDINNLHNSFVDILITLRCYMKITYNKDITDMLEFKNLFNEYNIF